MGRNLRDLGLGAQAGGNSFTEIVKKAQAAEAEQDRVEALEKAKAEEEKAATATAEPTPKKTITIDGPIKGASKYTPPQGPTEEQLAALQETVDKSIAESKKAKSIKDEAETWGAKATHVGQASEKDLAELPEAKEMAESPDGPKTAEPNLASALFDKLEAHHAHLTSVLKNLPALLRAHGAGTIHFGAVHDHAATLLENGGVADNIEPEFHKLRAQRDELLNDPQRQADAAELRKLSQERELDDPANDKDYWTDAKKSKQLERRSARRDRIDELTSKLALRRVGSTADTEKAKEIGRKMTLLARQGRTGVPKHIQELTVNIPSDLAALKQKMEKIRSGGAFLDDDPSVNHPKIDEFADRLNSINKSINANIKNTVKFAAEDANYGTRFGALLGKVKNVFGTDLSPVSFNHIKWQGKALSKEKPGQSWRQHTERHPEWRIGEITESGKPPLTEDDVTSKLGHMWGPAGKDIIGKRTKQRTQVRISPETAKKLIKSGDSDERELGQRMSTLIKDYNSGNSARYTTDQLPAYLQPTSGKYGSGVRQIKGEGDVEDAKAQILKQTMYPFTASQVKLQQERSDKASGIYVAPRGATPRSGRVVSDEAKVSKVAANAARARVRSDAELTEATEGAKKALTTYDKAGNTRKLDPNHANIINSYPDVAAEVEAHVKKHTEALGRAYDAIRSGVKVAKEDRQILGQNGILEAQRRAKL